ncbi:MAG: fructose-bisphosphatase class II [Deinococcales bacterium]
MERALVLDLVRVTEQAAIAASRVAGKGDADLVDQAGTDAMRQVLNELDIDGEIVIGEGERDEAPMLYIGEKVGNAHADAWEVDIAVDPVEGTNITAKMINNSVAVIAIAEKGGLFKAPDTYMEKLIVGPPAVGKVNINWLLLPTLPILRKV